jgi:hypothetical protein
MYLLGVNLKVNKLSSVSNYPRWNALLTSGTDGTIVVDGTAKYHQFLHQTNDIIIRLTCENENVAVRSAGKQLDGLIFNNGNCSVAGKHGVNGMQGGDIKYFKFSGNATAGAGTRPLWGDTNIMPYCSAYLHGFDMGTQYTDPVGWFDLYSWAASMQYSFFMTIPVAAISKKASDNSALGDVAIGVIKTSDSTGQIITAKGGTLNTTLAAGTNTTTLVTTGNGFADISVGDYCYNLTRSATNIVLTKTDDNTITTASVTGQTSGDIVNFKSRIAYAPTKKRFVVTDGSGEYASPIDSSLGLVVQKYQLRNGSARLNSDVVTYSPYTLIAMKYGYFAQSSPRDWEMKQGNSETLSLVANSFVVATEAVARAYTGIAISGTAGAMIITITEARTPQQIYDYVECWRYDQAVNNDLYYPEFMTAISAGAFNLDTTRIIVGSGGTLTVDTATSIGTLKFGTRPVTATNGILVQSGGTLVTGQTGSQGRSIDFASPTMLPSPFLANADIGIDTGGVWNWVSTEIQSHCGIRIKGSINVSVGNAKIINEGDRVNAGGIPAGFTIDENNELTNIANLQTIYYGVTVLKTASLLTNVSLESSRAGLIVGGGAPDNVWVDVSAISFNNNILDIGLSGYQWMRFSNSVAGTNIIVVGYSIAAGAGNQGLIELRQQVRFYLANGAKAYTVDTNNSNRLAANLVGTNPDYTADRAYELTASGGYAEYTTEGGVLTGVYWRTTDGTRDQYNMFDSRGIANDKTDIFSWIFIEYGKQVSLGNHILKGSTQYTSTPQFLPDLGITQATKATVAAYTGFASETATGVTITTSKTTSEVYDRRKYLESENPSYVWDNSKTSYCASSVGIQYDFSSNYTLTLQAELSGKKITGCNLVLDTGWGITCPLEDVTLTFTTAGTYDLSSETITGTVDLNNASGGAVTVQYPISASYTRSGSPLPTVIQSRPLAVTADNIPAGASVRVINVTQDTELDISMSIALAGYSNSFTVASGGEVEIGDTLTLQACKAAGAVYSKYYEAIFQVGATGDWTIIDAWEDWDEANDLSVDGSAVTDFVIDAPNVQIDINDMSVSGFWMAEAIGYLLYKTATDAASMRAFFGALTAQNSARWVVDTAQVNLKFDNLQSVNVQQTDEIILARSDGVTLAIQPTTGGGGIGIVIANDVGSVFWNKNISGYTNEGTAGKVLNDANKKAGNAFAVGVVNLAK